MPRFPLFNDGQMPKTTVQGPEPTLDREKRPRVDYRGVVDALGQNARAAVQLGEAAQMPDIPLDAMAGKFRGLSKLGAGISDLGSALGAVAEAQADIRNYKDIQEAEMAMDQLASDFEEWKMENPDPSTWEAEWDRRIDTFQQDIEGRGLSPLARDRVNGSFSRFKTGGGIKVKTEATRQLFQEASQLGLARAQVAADQGDYDGAMAQLEELRDRRLISEGDYLLKGQVAKETSDAFHHKNYRQGLEAMVADQAWGEAEGHIEAYRDLVGDDIARRDRARVVVSAETDRQTVEATRLINDDPWQAEETLFEKNEDGTWKNYPNVKGSTRVALEEGVRSEKARISSENYTTLRKAVDAGYTLEEAQREYPEASRLDPEDYDLLEKAAKLEQADIVGHERLILEEIQGYDAKRDGAGEGKTQEHLRARINALASPEGAEFLHEVLDQQTQFSMNNAGKTPLTEIPEVKAYLSSMADEWYEEGKFGQFEVRADQVRQDIRNRGEANEKILYYVPDPSRPSGRRYVELNFKDVTDLEELAEKETWIVDEKARQKASHANMKFTTDFWLKFQKGEFKTPAEAVQYMRDMRTLITTGESVSRASEIIGGQAPPTVTPDAISPDEEAEALLESIK